jgi:formamidopyrimidine-DNA glycosylase
MPELPEVEVSRLGITPYLENQRIEKIIVRQRQLRWLIPQDVHLAEGLIIQSIRRRAKYLLLDTELGSIVIHLGMSGRLHILPSNSPLKKHDHVDIVMASGNCLRFNDARRFGACLWQAVGQPVLSVLSSLGPEPLTDDFDGNLLYQRSRDKNVAVKNFIMDNKIVVGVGNIYANESLFLAGIDPRKSADKVKKKDFVLLGKIIKQVLTHAIEQGGTTLKDFAQADGKPGYFAQKLSVYGRLNQPCVNCTKPIQSVTIGQRNTFFCDHCQK